MATRGPGWAAILTAAVACGPGAYPPDPRIVDDPTAPRTLPHGTWPSPITATMAMGARLSIEELTVTHDAVWWLAPGAGGSNRLMRRPDGGVAVAVPGVTGVGTGAHEYGGGAYLITDDAVVFSSAADGRLYRVDRDRATAPRPITPAGPHHWADCVDDPRRRRLICVHDDDTPRIPVDTIAAVAADGATAPRPLISGHDFFAAPRLSPDGSRLAWLSWDFPQMPWDGTDLWTAPVAADGTIGTPVHVAGGPTESIAQPEWSPGGVLYFVSDRGGNWNLHRAGATIERVGPDHGDLINGQQPPGGIFDAPVYGFVAPDRVAITFAGGDADRLATIDLVTGAYTPLPRDETVILALATGRDRVALLASGPDRVPRLDEITPDTGVASPIVVADPAFLEPPWLSRPERIRFPTDPGATGEAFYYPPRGHARPPAGELPPLIVWAHGGPHARAVPALSLAIQYWTTRGFAVVDVNYGGSVGYGRAYRQRLAGQWGVVDVADCVAAARVLVDRGVVDGTRLVIRGGSAGGYTALMAVAHTRAFASAASWAGISDLELLDRDTEASDKFESHYNEQLIGPYPESKARYVERSPLHDPAAVTAPILFVHGDQDPVVPPTQSRFMHAALATLGRTSAYIELTGQGHESRASSAEAAALDAELYFHRVMLGIPVPPGPPPLRIENPPPQRASVGRAAPATPAR